MTFADILNDAMEAAGFPKEGGGSERFRQLLEERYGVSVTSQAISYWRSGQRTPRLHYLITMLDALGVHGEHRDEALRSAANAKAA